MQDPDGSSLGMPDPSKVRKRQRAIFTARAGKHAEGRPHEKLREDAVARVGHQVVVRPCPEVVDPPAVDADEVRGGRDVMEPVAERDSRRICSRITGSRSICVVRLRGQGLPPMVRVGAASPARDQEPNGEVPTRTRSASLPLQPPDGRCVEMCRCPVTISAPLRSAAAWGRSARSSRTGDAARARQAAVGRSGHRRA